MSFVDRRRRGKRTVAGIFAGAVATGVIATAQLSGNGAKAPPSTSTTVSLVTNATPTTTPPGADLDLTKACQRNLADANATHDLTVPIDAVTCITGGGAERKTLSAPQLSEDCTILLGQTAVARLDPVGDAEKAWRCYEA